MLSAFQDAWILTGPTSSGKTALALELADQLGAEIVSMDSMALYRGMDIGTAKPSLRERQRVSHHLIDVLDPWESSSVAWWLERAADCCRDIEARGKKTLFVGGTPLYLKALLYGLFDGPPADADLRERLGREAETSGRQALHEHLARVDSATAARVHPNDIRRVIRALEVWELTGRPISRWQEQWKTGGQRSKVKGENRCLCLDIPRGELYARIDARVNRMVEIGLIDEARNLLQLPNPLGREAAQAVGYKEMFEHLGGRTTLSEAVTRIQKRSRHFAKRQLAWFRHLPECRFVTNQLTFALWDLTIAEQTESTS
jgi:tRNA dimethylallyltransferase